MAVQFGAHALQPPFGRRPFYLDQLGAVLDLLQPLASRRFAVRGRLRLALQGGPPCFQAGHLVLEPFQFPQRRLRASLVSLRSLQGRVRLGLVLNSLAAGLLGQAFVLRQLVLHGLHLGLKHSDLARQTVVQLGNQEVHHLGGLRPGLEPIRLRVPALDARRVAGHDLGGDSLEVAQGGAFGRGRDGGAVEAVAAHLEVGVGRGLVLVDDQAGERGAQPCGHRLRHVAVGAILHVGVERPKDPLRLDAEGDDAR